MGLLVRAGLAFALDLFVWHRAIILTGAGMATILKLWGVQIGIGLAGGVMLLAMGGQMLLAARKPVDGSARASGKGPVWTGVVLSACNPYFLLWWAVVGMKLATQAIELGVVAFALFAVIHWLCDLGWLEALSLASFKGSQLLGDRTQRIVLVVCGIALVGFGAKFLWDAGWSWHLGPPPATAPAG